MNSVERECLFGIYCAATAYAVWHFTDWRDDRWYWFYHAAVGVG